MSLAKTCRMTLHYITTTHLHLCSGKTTSTKCFQFLFCFSLIQILLRNVLISSTMTFLFLYFVRLPFTEVVQSTPLTPSQLWIYDPLSYTPHPFSCFCGSFLGTQRLSPGFILNSLMFPLFLIYSFSLPLYVFSGLCLTSLHFLSHYKGTLTLSI